MTDPEGLAPEGVVDEVSTAITEFQRWTGREGVCVAEVRFVPELTEDLGLRGRYHNSLIEIDVDARELGRVTSHELCHALDLGLEHHTEQHRLLFDPPLDLEPHYWPDRNHVEVATRPIEVYARSCELGPTPLDIALETRCEDLPRSRFLLEQAFTGPWREYTWSSDLALTPQSLPLLGDDRYRGFMVPALGGLAVGRETNREDGRVDLSVAWASTDGRTAQEIPGPTVGPRTDWHLLGGEGEDPLLVVFEEEAEARAWRLDVVLGTLVEAQFPADVTRLGAFAWLDEGAIWTQAALGQAELTWVRIDRAEGSITPWALPDAHGEPAWPAAGGSAMALLWNGSDGWSVAMDGTEGWQLHPVPEALIPLTALTLEDGRVVISWYLVDGFVGFAWYDPTTDGWTLARTSCGADRLRASGALMRIDGKPYYAAWPNDETGSGFQLVSMVVP